MKKLLKGIVKFTILLSITFTAHSIFKHFGMDGFSDGWYSCLIYFVSLFIYDYIIKW
jgi:hypothetical protein